MLMGEVLADVGLGLGCVGEDRKHEGVRSVRVSPSWLDAVLLLRVGLGPCILWGFLGPGLSSTCHL